MPKAISIAVILLTFLPGCPDPQQEQSHPDVPNWPEAFNRPEAQEQGADPVYMVQLTMMTVEVPIGSVSESEKIWSHLDEQPVHLYQAWLGPNGFRVGRAPSESWPEIRETLQNLTGRQASESSMWTLPGEMHSVNVRPDQPIQTIFMQMKDGTLSGRDYPPGDNILTIQCNMSPDNPGEIVLLAQPQIRTRQSKPGIVKEGGSLIITRKPTTLNFTDLTFQLTVPNKDIVIIGPGADARRRSSVANHFLVKEKDGLPYETVLVIVPTITRAKVSTVDASTSDQTGDLP